MIMDKDIDYYLSAFEKMKRAIMRGVKAPHKPLLLLAILNLCQRGLINDNHIVLSSELVGEFKRLWRLYIGEQNTGGSIIVAEGLAMDIPHSYPFKCSIENPYYHLQHEPFWRLVKNEKGKERKFYSSLKSLRDGFAYAEIDSELYDLMIHRESAVKLECKLRELV